MNECAALHPDEDASEEEPEDEEGEEEGMYDDAEEGVENGDGDKAGVSYIIYSIIILLLSIIKVMIYQLQAMRVFIVNIFLMVTSGYQNVYIAKACHVFEIYVVQLPDISVINFLYHLKKIVSCII